MAVMLELQVKPFASKCDLSNTTFIWRFRHFNYQYTDRKQDFKSKAIGRC